MLLRDIAHSRTGDKGNISNVSVIAYEMANCRRIEAAVTPERLRAILPGWRSARSSASPCPGSARSTSCCTAR